MLAPVMAKDEFIEIDLELLAAHAVVSADQPLLQVSDGPIGQWHHRFRSFAKVALQGLGTWNVPEAHSFKTGEALETVRGEDRTGSLILAL